MLGFTLRADRHNNAGFIYCVLAREGYGLARCAARAFPEAINASSRGGHPNLRQLGDGLREGRKRDLSRREIFLRLYNCDIISIMIVVLNCA